TAGTLTRASCNATGSAAPIAAARPNPAHEGSGSPMRRSYQGRRQRVHGARRAPRARGSASTSCSGGLVRSSSLATDPAGPPPHAPRTTRTTEPVTTTPRSRTSRTTWLAARLDPRPGAGHVRRGVRRHRRRRGTKTDGRGPSAPAMDAVAAVLLAVIQGLIGALDELHP